MDRQRWHEGTNRNLQPGDLVHIVEKTKLKAKYRVAVVDSVKTSGDGLVRSAVLRYTIPKKQEREVCTNARVVKVERSVQRLVLLSPVEERLTGLTVEEEEAQIVVREESNEEEKYRKEAEEQEARLMKNVTRPRIKEKWILTE